MPHTSLLQKKKNFKRSIYQTAIVDHRLILASCNYHHSKEMGFDLILAGILQQMDAKIRKY